MSVDRSAQVEWASNIRPERQVWLWENRIPVGTASALAGRGGTGKTTYAVHMAAQLSQGTLPGKFYGDPRPTLIWSGEDAWSTVLAPRGIAAGADMDRIGRLTIASHIDGDTCEVTPRLPLDVGAIGDAIDSTGAALLVIDPIASTMAGDLHREADVRIAVDALSRLAADTGVVVLFVRHFGKGGGVAADKMSGSHAFRDAARSVFLFAADDQEPGQVVVSQDKGNYAPPGEESFAFRLENTLVPTDDGDAEVGRVVDLGASEVSVDDVINRCGPFRDADEHDEPADADLKKSWLYTYLADAAASDVVIRPKEAVAHGADKGISRASVFRLFGKLANAGMAESVDGDGFPKTTTWRLRGETTAPTQPQGETTETTVPDLQKQGGTTEETDDPQWHYSESTTDQDKQAGNPPAGPVVPPTPGELQCPQCGRPLGATGKCVPCIVSKHSRKDS